MADFVKPFSGNVPIDKMDKSELIRALRLDLAAEEEATFLYMAHAEATDDPLAKKVLIEVANEERQHIGEFHQLIQILSGDEDKFNNTGANEVNEMADELGIQVGKP